jgi:hypothetical protein
LWDTLFSVSVAGSKLLPLQVCYGVADGEAVAFSAPSGRSRFSSFFSSRFCSFFSCLVIFSAGVVDGVETAVGENVDAALGEAEAEGIGTTLRGSYFCICDSNFL